MARQLLLDTGFLVALVNREDPDHGRCEETWRELQRVELSSVEGVLVETAYMLRRVRGGLQRALELVAEARVKLVPCTVALRERASGLMLRYQNVPVDFVDAELVCVAEELDIREILTLDVRGFTVYRLKNKRRLTLFPPP